MKIFNLFLNEDGFVNVNKLGIEFKETSINKYYSIIRDFELAILVGENKLETKTDDNGVTIELRDRDTGILYGWFI